jgi:hypothetical protein
MSGGIGSADMDMDMDMDMSAGAVVVAGSKRVRPIGVSPALATVPDQNGIMEDWFHGNKWPPADFESQWVNAQPANDGFPLKYWDAKLFAITVLGEFVQIPPRRIFLRGINFTTSLMPCARRKRPQSTKNWPSC